MTDWEKTIAEKRQALARSPPGDLDHLKCLYDLACSLWSIGFLRFHRLEDMNEAIALYREVLALQRVAVTLSGLAGCLWNRYRKLGNVADIVESVKYYREAIRLYPAEHPDYSKSLNYLAGALMDHFKLLQLHAATDPKEGCQRQVLDLCPAGYPERYLLLNKLATHFRNCLKDKRNRGDLDDAIFCYREALTIYPASSNHPEYLASLEALACCLWYSFDQWGSIKDLEEAVAYYRQVLAFYPPGHPSRSKALASLASTVWDHFIELGKLEDLKEAIECQREVVALDLAASSSCGFEPLRLLAYYTWGRFKIFGEIEDLDDVISCYRKAMKLCSTDHNGYSQRLAHLASAIWARFQEVGEPGDLKEAITHFHEALGLKEHCNCSDCLDVLLNSVWTNFQQLGDKISHRRDYVLRYCEALGYYDAASNCSDCSNNPGVDSIWAQFQVSSKEAINYYRNSLTSCSTGHYRHTVCLNNLARALVDHFKKSKKIEYLLEAVKYYQEVVELCPIGHSYHPEALYNLTCAILDRYFYYTNALEDLEELESLYENIILCALKEDPLIAHTFCAQACLYIEKHKRINKSHGSSLYLDKAFSLFEQATNHYTSSIKSRFKTAEQWSRKAHTYKHPSAITAYSQALLLQQQHLFLFPSVESQQKHIAKSKNTYKSIALNGASCAIEMGNVETAVEFLEQGRAILWSKLHGYRQSLDELEKIDGQLAHQFKKISHKLEHQAVKVEAFTQDSLQLESVSDIRIKLQRTLFEEWSQILAKIRALEGFHNFLQPVKFRDLQKAASAGPVIMVNISTYHSDAIILTNDSSPVSISLPNATCETMKLFVEQLTKATSSDKSQKAILPILKGLWDMVVSPVKKQLDLLGVVEKSHIWWCPTSYLCALPLHAAGPYKKGQKNLPDIYISSYTLTLTSLIKARSNIVQNQTTPSILVMGQPDNTIPHVLDEILQIKQTGSVVNIIMGKEVDKKRILSELQHNSWAHFASHGYLHKQPFNSWFQLQHENLTVLDLATAQLPNAELAFLSACHSAAGDIHGTPDEVVHLAASLQFCGFKSVVGTLWAMVDDDGPTVAKTFYQHMFQNSASVDFRNAAEALNLATRKLRKDGISLDRWINFVHIGA